MWRHSIPALGSAALLQIACGAPATSEALPAAASGVEEAPADLVLHGVTFARLAGGRIAASGTAAEVRYQRAGGRFEARVVRGLLPRDSGPSLQALGDLRLSAPTVDGDLPGRRATATGGVLAVAERGDRAATATATADGIAGTIVSETPVEASGPGYTVRGGRLLARTDGSAIRLSGGTSGTLQPDAPARRAGHP